MEASAKHRTGRIVLVALLLGSLGYARRGRAQGEDLTAICAELEKLRGLKFKKKVPSEQQSLEAFEKYVREELGKDFPPDKRQGMMKGLLRLGMIRKAFDLGEQMVSALLSQAAAYYNPATGKFYVLIEDLPAEMMQGLAAHELVHALQDQHMDLGRVLKTLAPQKGRPRNDDRVLAARFLIEGEATYVQLLWQFGKMGLDSPAMLDMVMSLLGKIDKKQLAKMAQQVLPQRGGGKGMARLVKAIEEMDKIPPYILDPLIDAYMDGAAYVARRKKRGGWAAIDRLYKSLPASVEQCLHPEKAEDRPTPIALPALAYLEADGWKRIDAAVHGERYLRLLLQNLGQSLADARTATAGWDGDLYQAYANGDAVLIVLATTWDTPGDAAEFHNAYRSGLPRKYPAFTLTDSKGGTTHFACGRGLGTGILSLRGREVFIVEGADVRLCARILADLKAMTIRHVE